MHTTSRFLPAAVIFCIAAAALTGCAAESSAASIASQKQQADALIKLVPAANRASSVAITGGTSKDKSGSRFACDSSSSQFLTGRLIDVTGLKPQAFIEALKPKLAAQGYATKWYTASSPRKLVADKDGYEFWFASAIDKRDAKNPKAALVLTSFGKCFKNEQ